MSPGAGEGVSVILPVLNERENLEPLHARLTAALKPLGRDYEIVFVDDGSTDGTWDVMKRLVASDRAVRLVRLRRNFGQTAALAAGLAHSRHPIVVTLDADLQNDPADIPRLLAVLDAGDDVVCGWRRARQDPWLTRRLPSTLANWLIRRLTGVRMHDIGCTLRAYRRDVLVDVHLYGDGASDALQVAGLATLDGTLNVYDNGSYLPSAGQVFVVLTYGSLSGTFAGIGLPAVSFGHWDAPHWGDPSYPNALSLWVVYPWQ